MKELGHLNDEQQNSLLRIRSRVIDSIGKNMDLYGITLSIGHLYGNMYFNDYPVTLDEMSETMGMSKTSMSTGMRTLYNLKMINKVWEKGSRKDLYEVVPDWHQNFADYFSIRWRKAVEQNMSVLKRSVREIDSLLELHSDEENQLFADLLRSDKQRIEEALKYYKWLERLIESFETGDIFDFIPKEE